MMRPVRAFNPLEDVTSDILSRSEHRELPSRFIARHADLRIRMSIGLVLAGHLLLGSGRAQDPPDIEKPQESATTACAYLAVAHRA